MKRLETETQEEYKMRRKETQERTILKLNSYRRIAVAYPPYIKPKDIETCY